MNSKTETHIPTARESEAVREADWEKGRKDVSPNQNKRARIVDQTGVTTSTRADQHENADRVGRGDRPETPVNPASHAAEDQTERSHSKGVTEMSMGAKADRTIDHAAKTTLGRHVKSTADGVAESAARTKHVKSKRAESEKVFSK